MGSIKTTDGSRVLIIADGTSFSFPASAVSAFYYTKLHQTDGGRPLITSDTISPMGGFPKLPEVFEEPPRKKQEHSWKKKEMYNKPWK